VGVFLRTVEWSSSLSRHLFDPRRGGVGVQGAGCQVWDLRFGGEGLLASIILYDDMVVFKCSLHSKLCNQDHTPQTLNPDPQALNPRPPHLRANSQRPNLNSEDPQTQNLHLHPTPETPNPKPGTRFEHLKGLLFWDRMLPPQSNPDEYS
jgi:hypothetical protein